MANPFQAVMDRASQEPAAREKPPVDRKPPAPKEPKLPPPEKPSEPAKATSKAFRPVREGKRFVGAHFPPEVARQLKVLAAEDGTTIQELLEEAVDLLFVKNGKAKIADLGKK